MTLAVMPAALRQSLAIIVLPGYESAASGSEIE
jgi:hypothetical protein